MLIFGTRPSEAFGHVFGHKIGGKPRNSILKREPKHSFCCNIPSPEAIKSRSSWSVGSDPISSPKGHTTSKNESPNITKKLQWDLLSIQECGWGARMESCVMASPDESCHRLAEVFQITLVLNMRLNSRQLFSSKVSPTQRIWQERELYLQYYIIQS